MASSPFMVPAGWRPRRPITPRPPNILRRTRITRAVRTAVTSTTKMMGTTATNSRRAYSYSSRHTLISEVAMRIMRLLQDPRRTPRRQIKYRGC